MLMKDSNQPNEFILYQNYPNPFNPSTKISWQSSIGSRQSLRIYDVNGKEVEDYFLMNINLPEVMK